MHTSVSSPSVRRCLEKTNLLKCKNTRVSSVFFTLSICLEFTLHLSAFTTPGASDFTRQIGGRTRVLESQKCVLICSVKGPAREVK